MSVFNAPRHRNFYIGIGLGLVAGVGTYFVDSRVALASAVDVFFLTYLVLTAIASRKLTAEFLRVHAKDEDQPAVLILLVMLSAVLVSAISLFFVLSGGEGRLPLAVVLSIASVLLGWFAIHTMWALHYAFEYYQVSDDPKAGRVEGGLEFPGDQDPDGTAFFYFAYVIGMTAQTADTDITSNHMRRLVTVHSVFAFFFNTLILAAAVNIAVSLGH